MRTCRKLKVLMVGVVLMAASCGGDVLDGGTATTSTVPSDTPPSATLDGTSWIVSGGSIDGLALPSLADRFATLRVDGDQVTGSTGCNTYHASISTTSVGTISLTDFAVTEIGCEPEVTKYETAILEALRAVDRFTWDADLLTLGNSDGSVTLNLMVAAAEPEAAIDTARWLLTGITSGETASSIVAGTSAFLMIDKDAGTMRGNGGCNDFGASVSIGTNQMSVSDMTYTEIACDDGTMRQEAEFFRILAGAATWQIDANTLIVADRHGDQLTFTQAR